ncbi:tetratricopeptide repeat protein [uncultured Aquimarina sp.]|uniref:tetratricopeptide repeat protein n=1 Tax=uncultured Aquimarina sp. TaxID=575652 RepID=UPI00260A64E7|nr:tetratricopeptide repeat protein [uncultured Aquimarina sp.]
MNKQYTFLVIILMITFIVLLPTLRNDWTNLDDPIYILDNFLIRDFSWKGIQQMFTTSHVNGSYNPVVLLSWGLDYHMVGLEPTLYHWTNLLLHLIVVALVFCLALRLSKDTWVAFGTSLLFGIHPMHVESIAWITSRKELLYTLFYIAGLIAYTYYLQKDGKRPRWYYLGLCFLLYILSLLSKGSALTFPLILWAFDYLRKRKDTVRLFVEKIPFLVLSVIFTYISIKAQDEGEALLYREFYSVLDSLSVGFYGYLTYLIKVFIPYHLSMLHPYPTPSGTAVPWYFSAAAIPVLAIAIYCFYKIKTARKMVFGFGFFFITLIPVIQVLSFAVSVTADRFTYLPYFGIFYILSVGVVWLLNYKPKLKTPIVVVAISFVVVLSSITFSYVQTYKNSETAWNRVIKYYPNYFVSYVNRSEYRINKGRLKEALQDCNKAIALKPDYYLAFYNRGYIYEKQGRKEEAIQEYTQTIVYNDKSFQAYQNRGIVYTELGQLDKALKDFNTSILLKPKDAIAYLNRASLYEKIGKYKKAINDATTALSLNNRMDKAYFVKAKSFMLLGEKERAIIGFTNVIKINPKMASAYALRGNTYIDSGDYAKAMDDFNEAIRLDSHQIDAYINLGIILMNQGQFETALFNFNQAQKYDPENYLVYLNRGLLYKLSGNYKDALTDLEKSIQLNNTNNFTIQQKEEVIKLIKKR